MILEGIITFPDRLLYGYADLATQEESERLSSGLYHRGLIIFIPDRHINQTDIDACVTTEEEVAE